MQSCWPMTPATPRCRTNRAVQSGGREGCGGERARCWLLPRRARGRGRQHRDGSPSQWTQGAVMSNEPGRGTRKLARTRREPGCRGSCAAGFGIWAALGITALVSGDGPSQAIAPGAQRSEHRRRMAVLHDRRTHVAQLISAGSPSSAHTSARAQRASPRRVSAVSGSETERSAAARPRGWSRLAAQRSGVQ